MATLAAWVAFALMGCGVEEDTAEADNLCGEITTHEVAILGRVEDAAGDGVAAAAVTLVDEGWVPGTRLGEAVTDEAGAFRLDASEVTAAESCWGSVLRYELVATAGELRGVKVVTSYVHEAIRGGSGEANLADFPVVVE